MRLKVAVDGGSVLNLLTAGDEHFVCASGGIIQLPDLHTFILIIGNWLVFLMEPNYGH